MKKSVFILIFIFTIMGVALPLEAREYELQVDDLIYISVWGHDDLQAEARVDPVGNINFPLIGEVEVEGLSVSQVTDLVTEELAHYIKIERSHVNISLREYQRLRVKVLGEVSNEGTYTLRDGDKILDLISLAGGVSSTASNNIEYISDGGSRVLDLQKVLRGDIEENIVLSDGATLNIKRSRFNLRSMSFWRNFFFFVGGIHQINELVN